MKPSTYTLFNYHDDSLHATHSPVVQEFPVQLNVNGREIATLIGSPHELRFLVAGFLRLQNLVQSLSDFEIFSVCEDFGAANVRIKGEIPERLKTVLTSGCGTGVSFSLPDTVTTVSDTRTLQPVPPSDIFSLMNHLSTRAEQYKSHGGIHSAAVGRGGELLLYAEDLGRHNTLDRIAGEALFKGIELGGAMLVTSGRVSTEMVAKAALLGVRLIASRTSPTDMAIRLCEQSGICLVGYVRGGRFTVYSHPEQIGQYPDEPKIQGVCAAILAGGESSRMGSNKALLKVDGVPIITRCYQTLARLFREVIVITNTPQEYAFLPCRKVPDVFPGIGSIAGLHSALVNSSCERVFLAGCDMPFLNPDLIRRLCAIEGNYDAIAPNGPAGAEPLHTVYAANALDTVNRAIESGEKRIYILLEQMNTRRVTADELADIPDAARSFLNVNTPGEYDAISVGQPPVCEPGEPQKTS